ncbi:hypothetical protein [Ruminococcus albus]|uniref:Translation initiation factor 2 n=1 Tax=Ruminococcus albus (strain ATCC 27210 / DSM 20455 / JCM 14654 / NCDO 2250 / 7) TaxID=697329 RepID=E6UKR4_RUMA7|nr:hypothetical protein [Ruminococcus albus]ADU24260.1 hypothetical protein Rumal_3830 [Ruminococcus albus 7 = DSM 20455]
MKGSYTIRVGNSRLRYEFTICRNITILKGNSATGKTTLVEMIREYYEDGELSGIQLESSVPCRTLSGRDWKYILPAIENSIVFIDEDNDFLRTLEFAEAIRHSSNYYVIVTREGLAYLPYSVNEIYGIRESGKYAGLKQVYNEFYRIYHWVSEIEKSNIVKVVVEDTNSGYEFFSALAADGQPIVISAEGNSGVFKKLLGRDPSETCLVIADGAAFGSEIDRVMKLIHDADNVILYLPESFEWLILKSGLIDGTRIQEMLANPENYILSDKYFSWEQYFTALLIDETKDTFLSYSKKKLNPVYLHEIEKSKIVNAMDKIGELFSDN